jgi:hypothetical protein
LPLGLRASFLPAYRKVRRIDTKRKKPLPTNGKEPSTSRKEPVHRNRKESSTNRKEPDYDREKPDNNGKKPVPIGRRAGKAHSKTSVAKATD